MLYPETKTKSIVIRTLNFFVGSKEDTLVVPDHDSMQEKAIYVYLDTYRTNLVECELSPYMNIVQIAERITFIFKQLYEQKISESREDVWRANKLPQVNTCMCMYNVICTN